MLAPGSPDARDAAATGPLRSQRWGLPCLLPAAALCLAIALVDPVRQFMSQDDGWAYARSVEHLLATGTYRLDAWSAANNPVQIYLAAALAKAFGYSLAILRLPTLLLLVAGIAGLLALLRELAVPPRPAAVLSLTLLANPIVLLLGPTFMSDVQFMGWLVLSLWLYVRGFARRSGWALFAGSLAAACAIGTRQFGIALVIGVLITWCLPRQSSRPQLRHVAIALAAPLLMSLWQLQAGLGEPNFTQAVRLHEQGAFVAQGALGLAKELGWRMSTAAQYLGLLLLPLFLLMSQIAWRHWQEPRLEPRSGRRWMLAATVLAACFLVFALSTVHSTTAREPYIRVLPLPWLLPTAAWEHYDLMRFMRGLGLVGAFLGIAAVAAALFRRRPAGPWSTSWLLIAAVGTTLLGLHVSYVQLNDTYFVGLLPFALLALAGLLGESRDRRSWQIAATTVSFAIVVGVSLWLRSDYDRQEARWLAADRLVAQGFDPRCIGAPRHWAEYHGAFDDWLAAGHPGFAMMPTAGSPRTGPPPPLHPPFYAWLNRRYWYATVRVALPWELEPPLEWRLHSEVPAPGVHSPQVVRILARLLPRPADAEPCHAPK